jgi:hypothetical protein
VPFGRILNACGEVDAHELHELTRIKSFCGCLMGPMVLYM